MSVGAQPDPTPTGPPQTASAIGQGVDVHHRRGWPGKLLRVCFALFALEVGLFLVVFPWRDEWQLNYFQNLSPTFEAIWDQPYFKGALTGLGLVNVYIALAEIIRLLIPKRAS